MRRNEFHNPEHADRGDRMGALLGTGRKHHLKPESDHWTDLCPRRNDSGCASDCAHFWPTRLDICTSTSRSRLTVAPTLG